MKNIITKSFLSIFLLFPMIAEAINPKLFSDFKTESLTVKIVIPNPEKNEEVTLHPLLIKPNSPPPWNAVVIPSNCSGADDKFWRFIVPILAENNIASVLVDSFNPRGFPSVCNNQFLIVAGTKLQDVHQILDFMRADGRFNKSKIAISGHSTGAVTTLLSAFSEGQIQLGRKVGDGFNAFIGISTSCELSYRNPNLEGPLLLISGEKDDWTLPEPCKSETKRLQDALQDVTILINEGVYHTLSTKGITFLPKAMKVPPGIPHTYIKQLSYKPQKTVVEFENGDELTFGELAKKYGGFLGSKMFGANGGGDWDKATEISNQAVDFLKKKGW